MQYWTVCLFFIIGAITTAYGDNPPPGFVSITRYGATPNDSTLDTEAIQAALNSHPKVWIPEGRFLVHPQHSYVALFVYANRTLKGAGMWESLLVLSPHGDAHVVFATGTNIVLEDFGVNGTAGYHTLGIHGIRLANVTNATLQRLSVFDVAYYGIGLQAGTFTDITLRDIEIAGCGADGIDIKNPNNNNTGIRMEDINISDIGRTQKFQAGIDVRSAVDLYDIIVSRAFDGVRFRVTDPRGNNGEGGHYSRLEHFALDQIRNQAVMIEPSVRGVQVIPGSPYHPYNPERHLPN